MELVCPKCQGPMRSYERNGVNVDQCGECRGIFLDRGELERLVDAEAAFHSPTSAPPTRPAGGAGGLGAIVGEVMQQARSQQSGSYGGHQSHGYPRKKKKESFLGELFG